MLVAYFAPYKHLSRQKNIFVGLSRRHMNKDSIFGQQQRLQHNNVTSKVEQAIE